jgi:hypothetical protein
MPPSKLCVSRIAPAASAVPITICECKGRYGQRQYQGDPGDDQRPADDVKLEMALEFGQIAIACVPGEDTAQTRPADRESLVSRTQSV